MSEIMIEQVQEFYDFLMNTQLPDGMTIASASQPKLRSKQAFTVIWYLQEHLGILPDHYEMCRICHEIYDSDCEGYYLDDQYKLQGKTLPKKYWGAYCSDVCAPAINFELK